MRCLLITFVCISRRVPIELVLLVVVTGIVLTQSARGLAEDPAQPAASQFSEADLEFFEKQIRPLFAEHCFECHSGRDGEPKGGLRVDSRAALLAGGDSGAAVVPGDPNGSLLIDAVHYGDIYQMPPDSKLPDAAIARLEEWVRRGAPWPAEAVTDVATREAFDLQARKQAQWCWQPVQDHDPPSVVDTDWPADPLDRFILARLEAAGITPSPAADKRTLIRRAYFDLIGLPPSPAVVDAFLADDSPQAFERVVDELLDSPHFGERWARHWMDMVRYAETYGHEFDYPIPHASQYRDYLIRAFNADVPYDQLIREHVAGDLLEQPRRHPEHDTNESVIGTGFWWLGEATHAPVDVRGDAANRMDNQIDVMGKTFLGLTIACARCHDHKFDAISTADYYALWGFLQSSHRHEAFLDPDRRIAAATERLNELQQRGDAALAGALASSSLTGERFAAYLQAAAALRTAAADAGDGNAATNRLPEVAQQFGLSPERLQAWVAWLASEPVKQATHPLYAWTRAAQGDPAAALSQLRRQLGEQQTRAAAYDESNPQFADFANLDGWFTTGAAFDAASGDSSRETPEPARRLWDAASETPRLAHPGVTDSGRLGNRMQGVLRSPNFTLTKRNIHLRIRGQGVKVRLIIDGYFMDTYNGLLFGGFAMDVNTEGQFQWVTQSRDVGRYLGHRGHLEIIDHGDGSFAVDEIRFSDGGPPPEIFSGVTASVLAGEPAADTLAGLAAAYGRAWDAAQQGLEGGLLNGEQAELLNAALDAGLAELPDASVEQLATLRKTWNETVQATPAPQRVLAMADGSPENARLYIRGNHRTPGDEIPRRFLEALSSDSPSQEPLSDGVGSGRLQLADKIASPDNPLTARVFVNRLWHHLFGRGIVASCDNFGVLGQPPTHPELLDHLAVRCVEEGWSMKRMLRAIVLSRTYQMSSRPRPDAAEADPQNLLLHRQRVRRLEGEAIRDAVLAVSGRLDPKPFGPSVPVHITPFMQGRGRPGQSGPLDGAGRRSIYTEVRRNFLPPMMLAFDTPIPFNAVGRRNVSNVPAQALIMMNDPLVVEQARLWAERVIAAEPTPEGRIRRLYLEAFARPPSDQELAGAAAFLDRQSQELGLAADAAQNDLRPWADLCHVLFNVKEFVFIH